MATRRQPGEDPLDRAARRRQPVSLPARHQTVRYWFARSRNEVRRARRASHRVAGTVREMTKDIGAQYLCSICDEMHPVRDAAYYSHRHATLGETARKRKPISQEERDAQPRKPVAPPERRPSKTKELARNRGPKHPDDNVVDLGKRRQRAKTHGRWPAITKDLEDQMAGRPRRSGTNGSGTGGGASGGVAPSSTAAAVLQSFQAWAEHQPANVEELRADMLGMEAVFGMVADVIHTKAAGLVARRIHPEVAKPIDAVADGMADLRTLFSQAYVNFEKIYEGILAYHREQQHKPDESMFKTGS
jgi:hypothetical protein